VIRALFVRPFTDLLRGEARCLGRPADVLWLLVGLGAGWLVYVPAHELLHAFGCLAAGGEVTRLEIDPLYGAALLARVFPFVVPGGEYAGRLSGFDTGGSDLVYLATDLAPFVLTLLPGVWALRRAARSRHAGRAAVFGATLPFAFAPLLSLPGDAYEIGSVVATRLPGWSGPAARELVRGDDLFRVAGRLAESGDGAGGLWAAFVLAAALGVVWAFATWALGGGVATRLGQPPLEPLSGARQTAPGGRGPGE
jgi:hypothetical protein